MKFMQLIKIGGGEGLNIKAILEGIKALKDSGEDVVVVHGANAEMKRLISRLNEEETFLTSPSGQQFRYSDKQTMENFTASYCGIANKRISALATEIGLKAIGLSGIDAGIWLCERKPTVLAKDDQGKIKVIRDNFHGKIVSINSELITTLLQSGYTPIITAPGVTAKGQIVNIDNDTAVAAMVKKLKIKKVVSFIGPPGVMENVDDPKSLIKEISVSELKTKTQQFSGRMQKKILGAISAFDNGLEEMVISSGKVDQPFSFDFKTTGTLITNK